MAALDDVFGEEDGVVEKQNLERLERDFVTMGFRDAAGETQDKRMQEGFNQGYADGCKAAVPYGVYEGVLSVASFAKHIRARAVAESPAQAPSPTEPPVTQPQSALPQSTRLAATLKHVRSLAPVTSRDPSSTISPDLQACRPTCEAALRDAQLPPETLDASDTIIK